MTTRHEELMYWYTHFEDPNCLAVVELVATIMDDNNSIQVCTDILPYSARHVQISATAANNVHTAPTTLLKLRCNNIWSQRLISHIELTY